MHYPQRLWVAMERPLVTPVVRQATVATQRPAAQVVEPLGHQPVALFRRPVVDKRLCEPSHREVLRAAMRAL